jgi:hypothetical protein
VVKIDRANDTATLERDTSDASASRAAYDADCTLLARFEHDLGLERVEHHSAASEIGAESAGFQNGVHLWVLNNMKVPHPLPFDRLVDTGVVPQGTPPHVDGFPELAHPPEAFAAAGARLASWRGAMGAYVDDTVDTVDMAAEFSQHEAESEWALFSLALYHIDMC